VRLAVFLGVVIIFLASSGSHPVGRSGAPGDGLCSDCHFGGAAYDGNINLTGLPDELEAGMTYDIVAELNATSGAPVRGGFQVVALRENNNTQAGTWSDPDGGSSLKSGGGRVYFGHEPFRNFNGGDVVEWEASWQAPDENMDLIFYMVGNLANGNGSSSGDRIVVNQLEKTVVLVESVEITVSNITGVNCTDDENGSASAVGSGGTPPYSYLWSNGEVGPDATMLPGGFISVTVTDDDGNTASETILVPEPAPIEYDLELLEPSCNNGSDGMVEIIAFGGTGSLECFWDQLGSGCIQEDLEAGFYALSITDDNGCMLEDEIQLDEPDALLVSVSVTLANGNSSNGTATGLVTGGISPYLFEWSTGETTMGVNDMISGLSPGTYGLTVTDQNNCQQDIEFVIGSDGCALAIESDIQDVSCYRGSDGVINLNVLNATAPVSLAWSNGSFGDNLTGVPAGVYQVSITDANQCVDTLRNLVIAQPDSLVVDSVSVSSVNCAADAGGSIALHISGGTVPYSIYWSNGVTNDTLINGMDTLVNLADTLSQLMPGIYSWTIIDANMCTLQDSIEVPLTDTIPPMVSLGLIELYLDEDGLAGPLSEMMLSEGISDNCRVDRLEYTDRLFDCSDIGMVSELLQVFDSNGNSTEVLIDILVADTLAPDIDCNNTSIISNSCGTVEYNPISASDNCVLALIEQTEGLASGAVFPPGLTTVSYAATDNMGNMSECSFTVLVENDFFVDAQAVNASCDSDDGMVILDISGGTMPYTIMPPETMNLAPGVYEFVIRDAEACEINIEVEIEREEISPSYSLIVTDPLCNGEPTGRIELDFESGSEEYITTIDGVPGTVLDNLPAGEYNVVITEINSGCILDEQVVITEPDSIFIDNVNIYSDPCTAVIDSVGFDVGGGTAPYFSNINVFGSYEWVLVVRDENGCSLTEVFATERVEEELSVELVGIINASDFIDGGAIDIGISGGTPPYNVIWTDSIGQVLGTDEDLDGLEYGDYYVEVTDSAGCIVTLGPLTVDMEVSTGNITQDLFIVVPNPVRDILELRSMGTGLDIVELYSIDGRLIKSVKSNEDKLWLDMSNLSRGTYLVRLIAGEKQSVKKVFKY